MIFDDDADWFDSKMKAKEDFISNLVGNMTAEEIDRMEFTPEIVERAKHFHRIGVLGNRVNEDNIQAELIKAVANGEEDDVVNALEDDIAYYEKYNDSFRPENAKNEIEDTAEYDGRDDEMIRKIAEQIGPEWENENELELPESDRIDFSNYMKLM